MKVDIFKSQRMCDGYSSCFVRVSITALAVAYLVYMSKVRRHTETCRLLKIFIVWTSVKMFRSGDMALFACHDDRRLVSYSIKSIPMILDTITNGVVYELLAESDNYLN